MTLVVEDGTGLSNANAYVSIADCDDYQEVRGRTTWAALGDAEKEAKIIEATMYLDSTFYWIGDIASETQALGWPRINAEDKEGRDLDDMVPSQVVNACCELAYLAMSGPLVASISSAAIKRVKAGSVEVEYAGEYGNQVVETDKMAWINRLLSGLTKGSSDGGPNIALLKA